jgi:hypothetical protein
VNSTAVVLFEATKYSMQAKSALTTVQRCLTRPQRHRCRGDAVVDFEETLIVRIVAVQRVCIERVTDALPLMTGNGLTLGSGLRCCGKGRAKRSRVPRFFT